MYQPCCTNTEPAHVKTGQWHTDDSHNHITFKRHCLFLSKYLLIIQLIFYGHWHSCSARHTHQRPTRDSPWYPVGELNNVIFCPFRPKSWTSGHASCLELTIFCETRVSKDLNSLGCDKEYYWVCVMSLLYCYSKTKYEIWNISLVRFLVDQFALVGLRPGNTGRACETLTHLLRCVLCYNVYLISRRVCVTHTCVCVCVCVFEVLTCERGWSDWDLDWRHPGTALDVRDTNGV
jgi:hypothetical protein